MSRHFLVYTTPLLFDKLFDNMLQQHFLFCSSLLFGINETLTILILCRYMGVRLYYGR